MSNSILANALIGFVSALSLTLFLEFCVRLKISSINTIRSLGSFFTQKESNAYIFGFILNLLVGTLFAFCYILVFKIIPIPKDASAEFIYIITGVGIGFNHGMIAALVIAILFPSFHPVPRYRKAGLETAIFFAIAHIVYGCVLGALYNLHL